MRYAVEEQVLRSIPRSEGAHYLSAANAMKARFQQGTRERVFEALAKWEEGTVAEECPQPVCVLVGEAGTGKSTIASEFAKRLQAREPRWMCSRVWEKARMCRARRRPVTMLPSGRRSLDV